MLQLSARRLGLLVALVAFAALGPRWVHATDKLDYFAPHSGTQPVALTGGDTPSTYQIACSSNTLAAGATLLIAAQPAGAGTGTGGATSTTRPLRKRCFQNAGAATVAIGSSTVALANYWVIGESTNAATSPIYCTQNSGAYYCAPAAGHASVNVNVIQETQSVP